MDKEFAGYNIDTSLGFAIARMHWGLKTVFSRHLQDHLPGLTPERFIVLCKLWERDRRPQSEIADCSCKDTGNITRIVDALEANGYVRREGDPGDRRKRLLVLTDKGREAEVAMQDSATKCRARAFGCLTEEEYDDLFRLSHKVIGEIERLIKEEKGCNS